MTKGGEIRSSLAKLIVVLLVALLAKLGSKSRGVTYIQRAD